MRTGMRIAAAFAVALLVSGIGGVPGLQGMGGDWPGLAASPGSGRDACAGLPPRVVERQTGTVKVAGEPAVLPA